MKKILLATLFMLATLAWASAQQPGSMPQTGGGAATSPGSQVPGATQSQPAAPDTPAANAPVTEGCLGGSEPNFTITDKTGTTYKLNIPPNANTAILSRHLGESVKVAGNVNSGAAGASSIDVQGIGKGAGTCPGSGSSTGAQAPPKQ